MFWPAGIEGGAGTCRKFFGNYYFDSVGLGWIQLYSVGDWAVETTSKGVVSVGFYSVGFLETLRFLNFVKTVSEMSARRLPIGETAGCQSALQACVVQPFL